MWTDLPDSEVDPSQARSVADEVLSRRAYVDAARPPSLWERFQQWLFDLVAELFALLTGAAGRGLFGWVIIALFGAVIIWLLYRLSQSLGPVPLRDATPDPVIDVTGEQSPAAWLRAAEEAESAGDWRTGIRCRHRALITELIDRQVVAARPGQTAGEVAAELGRATPAAADEIDRATWLFKDVWYGGIEAGPAERDKFASLAEAVLLKTAGALQ